jgi:hypothetical protein
MKLPWEKIMAKTPSKYEYEPEDEKPEPKAKLKPEVKSTATPKEADPANPAHLEPYPEGDPQDPDGREVFKQAHGWYPEDFPPVGTVIVPEVPVATTAKKDK